MISAVTTIANRSNEQAVAIPSQLLDRISARLQRIQMLPAVAQQALQLARNPDCTIREFARIIEQDIKLAAEMLRMANSPIYCGNKPVATLTEASLRLGLARCKSLILASSFASLVEDFSMEESRVRDTLWRHGMVTAVIASNLNKSLRIGFQGEEFTAGLMHDLGRILLAAAIPHRFAEVDPLDFEETDAQLTREQQVLQTTHAEIGAWFAIVNELPDCLVEAIRYHHAPAEPHPHQRLTALVAAADDMANYVQRNESQAGYNFSQNRMIDLLEDLGVNGARANFDHHGQEIFENSCREAVELCFS